MLRHRYRPFSWLLFLLPLLWGCGLLATSAPASTDIACPTGTPYPTFTPYPTPTPEPTSAPSAGVAQPVNIAQRLDLVNAINDYRVQHGAPALRVIPQLMKLAASRTYLALIPINMTEVQIDPRVMPANYAWAEWTSQGNTQEMLALNTPEAILQYWLSWQGMPQDALSTQYTDIGATYLCDGERCAFVIIYGVSR